jgi:hypothetical protein
MSASRPCVSIVTALHDKGPYIDETMASVRGQTLTDWEMIVVENGSSDDGPERVERMAREDARVRLIRAGRLSGPGAARNAGLGAAAGEWVLFLDADDLIEPGHLASLVAAGREADVVAGGWGEFEDGNAAEIREVGASLHGSDALAVADGAMAGCPWILHAAIVRRGWLTGGRRWVEELDGVPSEDSAFWFRVVTGARLRWVPGHGAVYRLRTANSRDRRDSMGQAVEALARITENNAQWLASTGAGVGAGHRASVVRTFENLARLSSERGDGAARERAVAEASRWLRGGRAQGWAMRLRRVVGMASWLRWREVCGKSRSMNGRGILAIVVNCALIGAAGAATYHVSPGGSDTNDGLAPATAWRTLAKLSSATNLLQPGDSVLLERGGVWREQLRAVKSGTEAAPITYGAYGEGPKPRLVGSDLLDVTQFVPAAGYTNIYVQASPFSNRVNWVFRDGDYLQSAFIISGRSANPSTVLDLVAAVSNSWAYIGSNLYVNPGPVDIRTDTGRVYTAAVREDLVKATYLNHLVFRDLVTDESAYWDGGYGMRAEWTDNIRFENVEIYRAGKHHLGAVNANRLVVDGLWCERSMPDMWYGAASAGVSYSDYRRTNDTAVWRNVVVTNVEAWSCQAFYSHGEGLGLVRLENWVFGRSDLVVNSSGWDNRTVMIGGRVLDGGSVILQGNGSVVRDVIFDGSGSDLLFDYGSRNARVERCIFETGTNVMGTFILSHGTSNLVQNCVFVLNPARYGTASMPPAISLFHGNPFVFRGNLMLGVHVPVWTTFNLARDTVVDLNHVGSTSTVVVSLGPSYAIENINRAIGIEAMRSLGFERSSTYGAWSVFSVEGLRAMIATNGLNGFPEVIRRDWEAAGIPEPLAP